LTGLAFNAALFTLPFMAAALYQTVSAGDLIDYTPTAATRRDTLRALNQEAARFVRVGENRKLTWNNLIARELGEGDIAAARGFALTAPALLRGDDIAKIQRAVPRGGGDREYLAATLPLIEPSYARQRFRSVIGSGEAASFDVLGDSREIADTAQRWRTGETVDYVLFALGGATLGAPDAAPDDIRLGASVVKIARNGAYMTPEFSAALDAEVMAALPPDRLRAELDSIFQNREAIVDEGAAAALAFTRAKVPEAWSRLADDLSLIGAAARATSPAGAAQLVSHARDGGDLQRIRLLADAGGERAVAVGKRTPQRLILKAARGAIRWTDRLIMDIGWTLLATLGVIISTFAALSGAVRREWEGIDSLAVTAGYAKADAVNRARDSGRASSKSENVRA
jgi:hypothetical protein